jgi:hypothetical protein
VKLPSSAIRKVCNSDFVLQTDKASLLAEAVEYIKMLQLQLQVQGFNNTTQWYTGAVLHETMLI